MKSFLYCESCGRCISEYKLTKESKVVCKYGCKPKQKKLDMLKKAKEKEPPARETLKAQ